MIPKLLKLFSHEPNQTYFFQELNLYVISSNGKLSFYTSSSSLIARYFAHTNDRKHLVFNRLKELLVKPDEDIVETEEKRNGTIRVMKIGDVSFNVVVYDDVFLPDLNVNLANRYNQVDPDDVTECIISMTASHKLYLLCELFDAYSREKTYTPIAVFAEEWFKANKEISSTNMKDIPYTTSNEDNSSLDSSNETIKIVRDALNDQYRRFIFSYLQTFGSDPSNCVRIAEMAVELVEDMMIVDEQDNPEEEYVTVKISKKKLGELKNSIK
jgi:hypothetical protein